MTSTADRIIEFRKAKGLTQQDLADMLSVSRSLVSLWELGKRQPDAASIIQLADFLGVRAQSFAGDGDCGQESADLTAIDDEVSELVRFKKLEPEQMDAISSFLKKRSLTDNQIFMGRYLLLQSFKTIAAELGMKESTVKMRLKRMNAKINAFLEEIKNES